MTASDEPTKASHEFRLDNGCAGPGGLALVRAAGALDLTRAVRRPIRYASSGDYIVGRARGTHTSGAAR